MDEVQTAAQAFTRAATRTGCDVRILHDSAQFVRLIVTSPTEESTVVDFGVDEQTAPPIASPIGPTFAVGDLAAGKVLALFGRAEARDFEDVWSLGKELSRERLLQLAADHDPGFDRRVFAEMLCTLSRLTDDEFSLSPEDAVLMRAWFEEWERELGSQS